MKAKVFAFVALLAFTIPATAGGFEHWDKNADGLISAEELGEKKAHKIAKLDTDGDGFISKAEYDAYKAKKHDRKQAKETY